MNDFKIFAMIIETERVFKKITLERLEYYLFKLDFFKKNKRRVIIHWQFGNKQPTSHY